MAEVETPEREAATRVEAEQPSGETALVPFSYERDPVIDLLNPRKLELLRSKAGELNHAELAQALELAFMYRLDPFTGEIWFTKSRPRNGREGRVLIMVGRDGLRKIVQRNGLEMEGDVVRAKDVFEVQYLQTASDAEAAGLTREDWQARGGGRPFHYVKHIQRGIGEARGALVGSWARVYERRTMTERGWFVAPLEEYDPKDTSGFSPWSKQKSVMILAASERQAARQGTPLGGLLVEGEDKVIDATIAEGDVSELEAGDVSPLSDEAEELLSRARALGHAGFSNRATLEMAFDQQDPEAVEAWLREANAELDSLEQRRAAEATEAPPEEPEEAVEVPPEPEPEAEADGDASTKALELEVERLKELREDAIADDDGPRVVQLEAEIDDAQNELDALRDADQGKLL